MHEVQQRGIRLLRQLLSGSVEGAAADLAAGAVADRPISHGRSGRRRDVTAMILPYGGSHA